MATRSHLRRVLLAALVAVTVCSTTSRDSVRLDGIDVGMRRTRDAQDLRSQRPLQLRSARSRARHRLGDRRRPQPSRTVRIARELHRRALSAAAIVAVPDELLVTASGPQRLAEAVAEVRRRLDGSVTEVTPVNDAGCDPEPAPRNAQRGVPSPGRPHLAGARVQHRSQLPRASPAEQRLPPGRQPRRGGCGGERPGWRCTRCSSSTLPPTTPRAPT